MSVLVLYHGMVASTLENKGRNMDLVMIVVVEGLMIIIAFHTTEVAFVVDAPTLPPMQVQCHHIRTSLLCCIQKAACAEMEAQHACAWLDNPGY